MKRRTEALLVFLPLFLTYAGFFQASTWGAACRFDLARALVEQGTVRIDAYHENTGDKALLDGHYYSDKAPLPSYLGAVGVAIAHGVRAVTGLPARQSVWLAMAGGLAAAIASGLVTAMGAAVFFLILRDRGLSFRRARLAALLVFLGTTLFPYATVLQGHAPAAAWLFLFFHAAFPAQGVPSQGRCLLAGFAASAALATEYLTLPPLALLGWLALLRHGGGWWTRKLWMAAGALPGLLLLGIYHETAFGSPFDLGYRHVALPFFQVKMESGFFGIGLPDPVVALKLLFGSYRGLFFVCPVLLFALPGLLRMFRSPERRLEAVGVVGVFLYYLLLNSGYSTWHGGWAIGPRHLVPAIPLLGLGLAFELERSPWVAWFGWLSVFFMLAATAVQPEVPEDIANPLHRHLLPHFVRGELSIGEQGFGDLYPERIDPAVPDRWDAFLIGEAMRLPRHLALLPLALVWLVFSPWVLARRL